RAACGGSDHATRGGAGDGEAIVAGGLQRADDVFAEHGERRVVTVVDIGDRARGVAEDAQESPATRDGARVTDANVGAATRDGDDDASIAMAETDEQRGATERARDRRRTGETKRRGDAHDLAARCNV